MDRLFRYLSIVGSVLLAAVLLGGIRSATAHVDRPLFTVGERVMILVDCIPVTDRPPCYREIVLVLEVRHDGWIRVKDAQQGEWFVNPARLYAFQREPGANAAGE